MASHERKLIKDVLACVYNLKVISNQAMPPNQFQLDHCSTELPSQLTLSRSSVIFKLTLNERNSLVAPPVVETSLQGSKPCLHKPLQYRAFNGAPGEIRTRETPWLKWRDLQDLNLNLYRVLLKLRSRQVLYQLSYWRWYLLLESNQCNVDLVLCSRLELESLY